MKLHTVFGLIATAAISHAAPTGVDRYNVVWDSPSKDCSGSMPLGNGDIALNAWVEPSGDLVFYIAKTDSWDDNARLVKVGKVRITLAPVPPVSPFRQELSLADATLNVRYGDGTTLRVWVDANHPVIHVVTGGDHPPTATAAIELWRTKQATLPGIECSDVMNGNPRGTTTVVEPDTVLTGQPNRIGWYHHNIKSVGPKEHAEVQGMTGYPRAEPLLHRTFGALITAKDAKRLDDTHLESRQGFDIHVLTRHPSTPEQWLASMDELIGCTGAPNYDAHRNWWTDFWNRSWIRATSTPKVQAVPANNYPLRFGVDQRGGNQFGGEIRQEKVTGDFVTDGMIEAEVKARAGATGRIFDKIIPGGTDGFLLDVLPANTLRLIIGAETHTVQNVLPPDAWVKVVLKISPRDWCVSVNGKTVITVSCGDDAAYVSQMFALQRFITACAGRGRYPIKFNGSLFTVAHDGRPGDADYRLWGPGYWWQNTRLPYISMCADGDFEMMEPLWRMYIDDFLPLNKYRTKKYFGFDDSAYFIECVHFWGDVFNQSYGWQPVAERQDPLQVASWHKREWVGGLELVWMMLDNYEYTLNESLLKQRIIPTADAVIRFFDNYYKTDASGQLVMYPAQALETWQSCTNPMPELAGLRAVTARLLALPDSVSPPASRAYWKTFLAKLPPLPTRDTPSGKALAPGEKFERYSNCENPELYAVFPFRLCSLENDNRELGVNALKHRRDRGNTGWRQDDIFMAYLGLADDARQAVVGRARSHDKDSRFPAFWGPNFDWIPDQDHGGVLMKAFQAMLLQTDGDKIFLMPAWPNDWDCDFKLHAPKQTTIEGKVVAGKVTQLTVTPEARRKDVRIIGSLSDRAEAP